MAAKAAYDRLVPLFRLLEVYDVTRLAKAMAPMLGLSLGPHRKPVLPLPQADCLKVRRVLDELGGLD